MKFKFYVVLIIAGFLGQLPAHGEELPPLPKASDPLFLDKSFYIELSKSLLPPPQAGGEKQKLDDQAMLLLQKKRSKSDCERANLEKHIDYDVFFKEPTGPLTQNELDQIRAFITEVDQDAYFFVAKLKNEYPRERPFFHLPGLEPCLPKEKSLAYPSGHAAISTLIAMVAADVFPAKTASLLERADVIGNDRVLAGVHFPSDIVAGKLIARAIYSKLKQEKSFQVALEKAKQPVKQR